MENIKKLLFGKEFPLANGDTGKLFKSQKDLAEAIIDLKGHYKKIDSLRPFLSQALKSADYPKSRPLPKKMRNSIIEVSCIRIKPELKDKLYSDLEKIFAELKNSRSEIEIQLKKIDEELDTAKKIIILLIIKDLPVNKLEEKIKEISEKTGMSIYAIKSFMGPLMKEEIEKLFP